jgi:hypothetical protein
VYTKSTSKQVLITLQSCKLELDQFFLVWTFPIPHLLASFYPSRKARLITSPLLLKLSLFKIFIFKSEMPSASLTKHDLFILEKIKDPESGPSAPVLIDSSLPRDPHITDDLIYQKITQSERAIISSIQDVELQIANLKPAVSDPLAQYLSCVDRLDELVEEYPQYASARNNRAQALRRIYGDGILVKRNSKALIEEVKPLDGEASVEDMLVASNTILDDLSTAIKLLTPTTPFIAISCTYFSVTVMSWCFRRNV